jgi:hypothetical protein
MQGLKVPVPEIVIVNADAEVFCFGHDSIDVLVGA